MTAVICHESFKIVFPPCLVSPITSKIPIQNLVTSFSNDAKYGTDFAAAMLAEEYCSEYSSFSANTALFPVGCNSSHEQRLQFKLLVIESGRTGLPLFSNI